LWKIFVFFIVYHVQLAKIMFNWLQSAHRFLIILLFFCIIFLIGIIDYLAADDVVFSSFYALPVIGLTYFLDKKYGIFASLLACILAGFTDYTVLNELSPVIGWNFFSRLLLFIPLTFLIQIIKKKIEAEQHIAEMQRFLVQEIHHRLSNNIATTIGFLHLQMMKDKESTPYLMPIERRLTAMLNIHRKLYTQTGLHIHLKEYLHELISSFSETYQLAAEKIKIVLHCDPIDISDIKAQTIGLLINELMINSIKYAFPEKQEGLIEIRVKIINKKINIDYKDNGIGFDYVANESSPSYGIGMRLIEGFAKELNATTSFQRENGVRFQFEFHDAA
jgi:two-component sensor histidine kinase